MYGIVNKAIEDLVRHEFGNEKWENIKKRSGIDADFFISTEPYDDEITYRLATAASEELNIPLSSVLHAFGEWWVLRTGKERYGALMEAGGSNLREFLLHLPMFHNRVAMIFPKLQPPEFKVSHVGETSLHLHYISGRKGLSDFVRGLLSGLGKLYQTSVMVELVASAQHGTTHEEFKVSWN